MGFGVAAGVRNGLREEVLAIVLNVGERKRKGETKGSWAENGLLIDYHYAGEAERAHYKKTSRLRSHRSTVLS